MAPAARKEPAPPDQPEPSFDARLARLEAIVAELENGGLALEASLNTLAWPQVSLILIIILATVVVSEWVTAEVRKRII